MSGLHIPSSLSSFFHQGPTVPKVKSSSVAKASLYFAAGIATYSSSQAFSKSFNGFYTGIDHLCLGENLETRRHFEKALIPLIKSVWLSFCAASLAHNALHIEKHLKGLKKDCHHTSEQVSIRISNSFNAFWKPI